MSHAVKFLVVAFEAVGKTTVISQLEDALVISTDNKAFTGKVPHFRQSTYSGLGDLTAKINEKVQAYEAKYGKYPKTIVVDSVTHLANNIEKFCNIAYTGFNVYSNLSKDILAFNEYLEDSILANGVNVVLTAHCQLDEGTGRYVIHTAGSFGKQGSWLAVTDNASYIEVKNGKRIIHHTSTKFPCRSLLGEIPAHQPIEEYDINAHINALTEVATDSADFSL